RQAVVGLDAEHGVGQRLGDFALEIQLALLLLLRTSRSAGSCHELVPSPRLGWAGAASYPICPSCSRGGSALRRCRRTPPVRKRRRARNLIERAASCCATASERRSPIAT